MKKDLLVTLANYNYLNQAKQLFSSVYHNAGWKGDYMLLSHEIPDEELKWFESHGILVKICESLRLDGVDYYYNPVVLDKFYLFTPEFQKWSNIIFLDCDIIVRGPLEKLTKVKKFAAVADLYSKKLKTQFFDAEKKIFNGKTYDTNVTAFNSGVFSFRTEIIKENTFDELVNIFNTNREDFQFLDQATLNLYFYKKWEHLPYIYNVFMACHETGLPKIFKCLVMHFITAPGQSKLWEEENPYFNEWIGNLEKADDFDADKVLTIKQWSELKITLNNRILKRLIYRSTHSLANDIYYFFKSRWQTFRHFLSWAPERFAGFMGRIIRKLSPALYRKLKRKN